MKSENEYPPEFSIDSGNKWGAVGYCEKDNYQMSFVASEPELAVELARRWNLHQQLFGLLRELYAAKEEMLKCQRIGPALGFFEAKKRCDAAEKALRELIINPQETHAEAHARLNPPREAQEGRGHHDTQA